jgi:deoxyribodipyrimidine photo-lyase
LAQNEQFYANGLVWIRRDLRTRDHGAFYHALKARRTVHCAFVFGTEILA